VYSSLFSTILSWVLWFSANLQNWAFDYTEITAGTRVRERFVNKVATLYIEELQLLFSAVFELERAHGWFGIFAMPTRWFYADVFPTICGLSLFPTAIGYAKPNQWCVGHDL
jgi:hypothetical protein